MPSMRGFKRVKEHSEWGEGWNVWGAVAAGRRSVEVQLVPEVGREGFPCGLAAIVGTAWILSQGWRGRAVDCVTWESWRSSCQGQDHWETLVENSQLLHPPRSHTSISHLLLLIYLRVRVMTKTSFNSKRMKRNTTHNYSRKIGINHRILTIQWFLNHKVPFWLFTSLR